MFTFVVSVDWAKYRRNIEVSFPETETPTLEKLMKKAEEMITIDAKCEKAAPWHSSKDLNVKFTDMYIWDGINGCWSTLVLDCQLREKTQIWCFTSCSIPDSEPPKLEDIPRTRSGFSQLDSNILHEPLSVRLPPATTPARHTSAASFATPLSTPFRSPVTPAAASVSYAFAS
eukprot:TRINITY_DN28172_c0_g1_i1.p1 TRINITY_DN28172_c0_g1~~TRINITY_DN28172_c0_g1_i1.p1  ORF type:complete len:173 (+),score=18.98 TRINITY_DN28172_c0_g1_i1:39-557(+)